MEWCEAVDSIKCARCPRVADCNYRKGKVDDTGPDAVLHDFIYGRGEFDALVERDRMKVRQQAKKYEEYVKVQRELLGL